MSIKTNTVSSYPSAMTRDALYVEPGLCGVVKDTSKEYANETGINGLSNAGKASQKRQACRLSAWLVIFIIGGGLTVWNVYYVLEDFLEFDVTTTISVEQKTVIAMPAVTVCNQNQISCPNLLKLNAKCKMNIAACRNSTQVLNITNYIYDNFCSDSSGNDTTVSSTEGNSPTLTTYGEQTEDVSMDYDFMMYYMALPLVIRSTIGHQFSDFIKGCTFRGMNCLNESIFFNYPTPGYGNCFAFNKLDIAADPEAGKRVSSLTGPKFGLTLVLNIHPEAYMTNGRTEQSGARVTIYSPLVFPPVADAGIDVPTNVLTNIALEKRNITRKEYPYVHNCTSDWNSTNYTDIIPTDWEYSLKVCQRVCIYSMITMECGCYHPYYLDHPDWEGDFAPCNLTAHTKDADCTNVILKDLDEERRKCSCYVDCEEQDYLPTISGSTFPAVKFADTAHQVYGNGDDEKSFVEAQNRNTGYNLIKLNIYYQHLNVMKITEDAEYGAFELCSSIGGALSLWLGISLAMFFEVVEFIITIFFNMCRHCSRR